MSASYDVIVVGAGIGGLSAALHLACEGYRVGVFDGAQVPGGKAGIETLDGVELDTGPSLFTLTEVLRSLLAKAGRVLEEEVELRRLDPSFRYVFADGVVLDMGFEAEASLASVEGTLGPAARDQFRAFLDYSRELWEAAAPAFVFAPAPSLSSIRQLGARKSMQALTRIDALRSMQKAIESKVRDPYLHRIFLRYATYNGSDPRRAPATLNCIPHVEFGLGAYGVQGGMYEIVRAIVRAAESKGVEFHQAEAVQHLWIEGSVLRGIESARGRYGASAVVVNAAVEHLFETLMPQRQEAPEALEPSMSAWNALVRVPRRAERAAHTVCFPAGDYLDEFRDIFDRDLLPADPTLYVCAPEKAHGRQGWPEEEALFVMVNAPATPRQGPGLGAEAIAELREKVLRSLAKAEGCAQVELLWQRAPKDLAARFPGSRGSIYGGASNSMFSAFRRPANRVKSLSGLYLASGGAHPGGGVPMSMLSGQHAAAALLEDRVDPRGQRKSWLPRVFESATANRRRA